MKEWLARFKEKPWIAHMLRAVERFNNRLGTQFGAAITYFSVLALVPLVLLAFSIIGFVLTVVRPDLLDDVVQLVGDSLGGFDPETHAKIVALISDTLSNWQAIGIVGLLAAAYSGAGWMGKLKNAVRAASRPDFDLRESQGNYVKKTIVNLGTLLCLFVLIVVTFALASLSTALSDNVVALLGLTEVGWLQPVLRFAPIVISIGAGWVLFMFIYTVLPEEREPWPIIRRGALLGAIGLAVLQYSTGLLFNLFSGNKAASIFGPVIVLMLVFNLFSLLIVFVRSLDRDCPARGDPPASGEGSVRPTAGGHGRRAGSGPGPPGGRGAYGPGRHGRGLRHRRGDRRRPGGGAGLACRQGRRASALAAAQPVEWILVRGLGPLFSDSRSSTVVVSRLERLPLNVNSWSSSPWPCRWSCPARCSTRPVALADRHAVEVRRIRWPDCTPDLRCTRVTGQRDRRTSTTGVGGQWGATAFA